MDMTLTAELLDPGDGNWTMGDCYHVFSSEEAVYPNFFFKSFFPSLLGLNDMLAMVGVLNIATETQRASPLAKNVEEIAICGSEDVVLHPTWRHQLYSGQYSMPSCSIGVIPSLVSVQLCTTVELGFIYVGTV